MHLFDVKLTLSTIGSAPMSNGSAPNADTASTITRRPARPAARANAGNIYVNRNLIGAVVGVQPFGGHGLSGTGPKAGGPLYLRRLLADAPAGPPCPVPALSQAWQDWVAVRHPAVTLPPAAPALAVETELPGPVGERNLYSTEPRGTVACIGGMAATLRQVHAALATGNRAVAAGLDGLPPALAAWVRIVPDPTAAPCEAVLFEGAPEALVALQQAVAQRDGPLVPVLTGPDYDMGMLVRERLVSTNTAAAGGNANLMAIG